MPKLTESLLSGRRLARNTFWNFGGMAVPLLVGLFAIPALLKGMGTERFGLLAIIWMGVGYFSLFDMGLGRALTKLIAERLGVDNDQELPAIVWTGLCLIVGLGLIGMIGVILAAGPLISLLNVPANLVDEGVSSFRLLAVGIPIVISTSAMVGILSAYQRFPQISAIRIPLGVMTFLGPVITLQFSPSLVPATILLIVTRAIGFIFYYAAAAHVGQYLRRPLRISRIHLRPLVSFGGWLTVSTVIGPIMLYFDRFLIGGLLTLTAVAYYTTPYEVLSRVQVLPHSLFDVLFPAFATAFTSDTSRLTALYSQTTRFLASTMLPLMALLFLFAPELLTVWLGDEFSRASTPAARWLALGWFHVMIARIHSIVLQSTGRPDLLAKAHMAEFLPYLGLLLLLTTNYGISGTAIAWFVRALADAILLTLMVGNTIKPLKQGAYCSLVLLPVSWIGFYVLFWIEPLTLKSIVAILVIASGGWLLVKPLRQLLTAQSAA